ncbi:MAG: hypothetical protein HY791_12260 [Deltaproteobacteria bacterium]|nr:hypothetical protein [Deltaproteobacteria bacterium]
MDRIDQLVEWLENGKLAQAADRRRLGNELDRTLATLESAESTIQKIERLSEIASLASAEDHELVSRESKRILEAGSEFLDAHTAEDLRHARDIAWREASNAVENLGGVLRKAWRAKCEVEFGQLGRLGKIITGFPALAEVGAEMKRIGDEGRALAVQFPPTKDGLSTLGKLSSRTSHANQALARAGGGEVAEFLSALAANRATLADISPRAIEWIRSQSAERKIRLILADE